MRMAANYARSKSMNTNTGLVHLMNPGETKEQLAQRIGAAPEDIELLSQAPSPVCDKCKGRGSVPAGFGSKRFKRCDCTFTNEELKRAAYERKHQD